MAERSKALVLGTSQKWREFESRHYQIFFIFTFYNLNYLIFILFKLSLSNCLLKENDMILLSIQNENQIGISQGFIKSISSDKCSFLLLLDKTLDAKKNKFNLFRVDKINYRSSICSNYSNLMKLMEPTSHAAKLREIIIDRKRPSFEKALPRESILKVKPFFKNLNKCQQLASIKVG